jgi:hypothetical protein
LKRGIPALCIFDEAAVTGSSGVCVDLDIMAVVKK